MEDQIRLSGIDIYWASPESQDHATSQGELVSLGANYHENWGLFSDDGLRIDEIAKPGAISIIDLSQLGQGNAKWNVRSLVVGVLGRKLLKDRMRRKRSARPESADDNLIWLMIDEAHLFLPRGQTTAASRQLDEIIKVGRQPGINIVFATQNPAELSSAAITQSDIVIAHLLTAKEDIQALSSVQSVYSKDDLREKVAELQREPRGTAVVLDDRGDLEPFLVRVRPRRSQHGGRSRSLFDEYVSQYAKPDG